MDQTEINDNLRSFLYKDFILPSSNPTALEGTLASRFLYGSSNETMGYYKDVISLALSQLGEKKGVSFGTFTRNGDVADGHFFEEENKVVVAEDFINERPRSLVTLVLSHETFHKHQYEVNKQAKLLGKWQDRYTIGTTPAMPALIGFGNRDMYYRLNNCEREAYAYDGIFTNSFLTKAQELATFMKDDARQAQIAKEQDFIRNYSNVEMRRINTSENLFISRDLPGFYKSANQSFKGLVSLFLDLQSNSQDEVRRDYSGLIDKLNLAFNTDFNSNLSQQAMVARAMPIILSACPKKENVESFIDTITTCRTDVGDFAMRGIIKDRVPITKGDFTRLALSSNNGSKDLPRLFNPEILDKVDETEWVKNLVLTMGTAQAQTIIEQFKTSGGMPNTDFDYVEKYLSSFSSKPMVTINGTPFYSCRDILQYVSERESRAYEKFGNNVIYYQSCGMYSKNLANIINHFDNPSADNPEFVSALNNFVVSPKLMQFSETETRSERSLFFTPKVSEELENYMQLVREQGTENNPQQTQYNPVADNGNGYTIELKLSATELAESIAGLAKSIQKVADTINEIGIPKLLERLGITDLVSVENAENNPIVRVTSGPSQEQPSSEESKPEILATVAGDAQSQEQFARPLTMEELAGYRKGTDIEHSHSYYGIVSGLQLSHEGSLSGVAGNINVTDRLDTYADMHIDEEQDSLGIEEQTTPVDEAPIIPAQEDAKSALPSQDNLLQSQQGNLQPQLDVKLPPQPDIPFEL